MLQSLNRIIELNLQTIFPSHGSILNSPGDNPKQHIQNACDHLVYAGNQIFDELKKGPQKFRQLAQLIRHDNIWTDFFPSTMAYSFCRYLEEKQWCVFDSIHHSFSLTESAPESFENNSVK